MNEGMGLRLKTGREDRGKEFDVSVRECDRAKV